MTQAQDISLAVSRTIEHVRVASGVTQRELADKAGIPLVTLNRKLTGRSPFNAVEMAAIAEALGTSLTDIALKAERSVAPAAA